MASIKRVSKHPEEPVAKKAKVSDPLVAAKQVQRVVLNPADSDIDFNVEEDGLQGSGLHGQGFAYCWSGARANVGVTGGKYCFGCKVISSQQVHMEDTPADQQHVCRIGISRGDDDVGKLGETAHSFGFGGTGKFSSAGKFSDYGEKYGIGDTVVCSVNLENKPLSSISFSKNGKCLGAMHFDAGPNGLQVLDTPTRKLQWESALFPHVLLKNVIVQLQFSIEDGLFPELGYKPWASAIDDGNALLGPTFSDPQDCEVIMMVGLPASGKTTWAEKWIRDHPEKRYVLLGTNLVLDQMKVPGLLRKHNYGERFDRLMGHATGVFDTLLSRASKIPRNVIIDQTNVYKNARKRKLRPFVSHKKTAVVVFPTPEELKFRSDKRCRELGKEVPAEAIDEMTANFVLPTSKDIPREDESFDQVMFPEQNLRESQRYLDDMKAKLNLRRNLTTNLHEKAVHEQHNLRHHSLPLQNQVTLPGFVSIRNGIHSKMDAHGTSTCSYANHSVHPFNVEGVNSMPSVSIGVHHGGITGMPARPHASPSICYGCYGRVSSAPQVATPPLSATGQFPSSHGTANPYGSQYGGFPPSMPSNRNYSANLHQHGGYTPTPRPPSTD